MASLMSHAWYASLVAVTPMCETAKTTSRPTARTWLRLEMPRLRGMMPPSTGKMAGPAMVARMNALHTAGEVPGTTHATRSVRKAVGADMVRRRLSSIFQRPIIGRRVRRMYGSSCQSPRAQRC